MKEYKMVTYPLENIILAGKRLTFWSNVCFNDFGTEQVNKNSKQINNNNNNGYLHFGNKRVL